MSLTKAIIAKEFQSYFRGYNAYIISMIYFWLLFAVMFYMAYFFEYNNQNLFSFFIYQPDVLNILIPALTMKMWAEEHKTGTLEFLLTQPVKIRTLVFGKFAAAFLFAVLLMMMTIPFMIYIHHFITLDWSNILLSCCAVILCASVLCALGCCISACCRNSIMAYLASVFCGWIWENINFNILLTPVMDIFPLLKAKLSGILNFREQYQEMIQGQLSIGAVVYFICLTGLILCLNSILVKRGKR